MTAAAKSLFAFGIYAVAAGAGLALMPNVVLAMLRFPPAADGWIRVVGTLAVFVGIYHMIAARNDLRAYIAASVWVRLAFGSALAMLVVTSLMPAPLLIFAAVDVAGAIWTALALRTRVAPAVAAA
jgi:hypothetical protein